MAKTYKPRTETPIVAVRCMDGLIVSEGHWLIVDGDKVASMPNDLFEIVYGEAFAPPPVTPEPAPVVKAVDPTPAPPPPKEPKQPKPIPAAPTLRQNVRSTEDYKQKRSTSPHTAPRSNRAVPRFTDPKERMMAGQCGRFIYYMRRLGGRGRVEDIHRAVFHECDKNMKSLSASLSTMKAAGLVEGIRMSTGGLSFLWTVTDEGIAIADKVGLVCFTDYDLRVPPDTMEEPKPKVVPPEAARILHNFGQLGSALRG